MSDETRFDRLGKNFDKLGDKVDELTKVITDLARIEERMVTLFKRMDKYDTQQVTMDGRLSDVEEITIRRGVGYQIAEKLLWIAVGGSVTWIVKLSEVA